MNKCGFVAEGLIKMSNNYCDRIFICLCTGTAECINLCGLTRCQITINKKLINAVIIGCAGRAFNYDKVNYRPPPMPTVHLAYAQNPSLANFILPELPAGAKVKNHSAGDAITSRPGALGNSQETTRLNTERAFFC
jgi:hypothetical protein